MRGIGAALVIVTHVLVSLSDASLVGRDGGWRIAIMVLRTALMPPFFLASGIFIGAKRTDWSRFLRGWLPTLVWPYLLWSAVILVAEWLGRGVRTSVDTTVVDVTLLWTPVAWLWFIEVLAIFQLLARTVSSAGVLVVIAVAGLAADALLPLPILAHLCCYFLIFFASGAAAGPRLAAMTIPWPMGLAAILLTIPLVILTVPGVGGEWILRALPAAVAGLVALGWMGQRLAGSRLLQFLGRRSMAIYIVNIFFIAAARIVLVRFLGITAVAALLPACLAAAAAGSLSVYAIAARLGLTVAAGLGHPAYSGRSNWSASLPNQSPDQPSLASRR